eukprot:SAG22_NODE_1189_length_5206_cov_14.857451_3_plen_104_part_00
MYFVLYMCICAFLILNLFIGIITTEMQEAKIEATKKAKVKRKLAVATRLRHRKSAEDEGDGDGGGGGGDGGDVEKGGQSTAPNPMFDDNTLTGGERQNAFERE